MEKIQPPIAESCNNPGLITESQVYLGSNPGYDDIDTTHSFPTLYEGVRALFIHIYVIIFIENHHGVQDMALRYYQGDEHKAGFLVSKLMSSMVVTEGEGITSVVYIPTIVETIARHFGVNNVFTLNAIHGYAMGMSQEVYRALMLDDDVDITKVI